MPARRRQRPQRRVGPLLFAVAVAAASVGCSDGGTPATDLAESGEVAGAAVSGATTTSVVIQGEPINRYTLVLGDCFSTYEAGTDLITTRLACEQPHQREVFATHVHPARFGEPWPGEEALQKHALRLCYADFAAFTGVIYELSELAIGAVTPPRANWDDPKARYRGIQCYLGRSDGKPLVGSMRNRGL